MNNKPLFSIGIPTKNRSLFLDRLLDNIVATRINVPVVISDNNSVDETPRVVESYKNKLNIIYKRHSKDLNIGDNFNSVLDAASTKYLLFISDDDLFLPYVENYYLQLINYLDENAANTLAVYVNRFEFKDEQDYSEIIDNLNPLQEISSDNVQLFDKDEFILHVSRFGNGGHQPGMLINLELARKNEIYFFNDGGNYLDKLYFMYANKFYPVAYCSVEAVCYRIYEGNVMKKNIDQNCYLFTQKIEQIISDAGLVNEIKCQRLIKCCYFKRCFNIISAYLTARTYQLDNYSFLRTYFTKILRLYLQELKKKILNYSPTADVGSNTVKWITK